ncbi:MAG: LptE family protein [Bacteroidota bacterium]|nr:LptE family protein [Bacteroidota bacterium]MDP4205929.1 LptE family protein [Bacteroidota bacterium]
MPRLLLGLLVIAVCGTLSGCKMSYSFSGASIDPSVKTFRVEDFPNRASLVNPNFSNQLTESLKDKMIKMGKLRLERDKGDLEFTGQIIGYEVRPVAITGNEIAAMNRLTVTIKVKFVNNQNHDNDFDTSFSAYADFPSTEIISSVENTLSKDIIEKLTDDIFNKSVANW